ncbi:thioredoxin reductase (NADPH) [Desulfocicer vacuolatum DSM 3385]|uniref:Thioredoxin reductase (NADPH) n=1 Tax=Desulfocicer vacuolatum DSM 3385 TaxID=1121400 RepID=A0A1W2DPW8_9BACT|nr:FAD-dependent oxidoreductase [Desulfocicer vacuolatum]SMC99454.1 thioredoxin reductase (NADPH) [Desulfocicer vacuolatum DSM 3385]
MQDNYDIIILGGGIAGMTAAIYAARANLKTVILEKSVCGGLVNTTYCLENFPSQPGIGGMDLMEKVRDQVTSMGVEIREVIEVDGLSLDASQKEVKTDEGTLKAPVVILATGRRPRQLPLDTDCESIHYCAICDGSGYKGKRVLVVGGGNSGIEESDYLLSLGVSHITIVEQMDRLMASAQAQEELLKHKGRVDIFTSTEIQSLDEENDRLKGVTLRHRDTGEITSFPMDGIFVYMGHETQVELFQDQLPLNSHGYINVAPDMGTGLAGVYAAGDIVNKKYYQITTAMNDATVAALSAAEYLRQSVR